MEHKCALVAVLFVICLSSVPLTYCSQLAQGDFTVWICMIIVFCLHFVICFRSCHQTLDVVGCVNTCWNLTKAILNRTETRKATTKRCCLDHSQKVDVQWFIGLVNILTISKVTATTNPIPESRSTQNLSEIKVLSTKKLVIHQGPCRFSTTSKR